VEAVRSSATLRLEVGPASWGLEHAKLFWAGILDNLDCALTWLDTETGCDSLVESCAKHQHKHKRQQGRRGAWKRASDVWYLRII